MNWLEKLKADRAQSFKDLREVVDKVESSGAEAKIEIRVVNRRLLDYRELEDTTEWTFFLLEGPPEDSEAE